MVMMPSWQRWGIGPNSSAVFQHGEIDPQFGNKLMLMVCRSMLGLAFAVLNVCTPLLSVGTQLTVQSWTALSASLSISLTSGGSTSVIWGLVTAGFCNLCIACSLAEFLSAYPTYVYSVVKRMLN
jgi:hypothetical protein